MRLSDALELYLNEWSVARASGSVRVITARLVAFQNFIENKGLYNLYDINIDVISLWIEQKKGQVKSELTVFGYFSSLRQFLNWCATEMYIKTSPIPEKWFKAPSVPVRRVPTVDEAEKLMETSLNHGSFPLRTRAILELAYGSGLRRAEIISLNLCDIRGDEIRVFGKGRKGRIVPLGKMARRYLDKYIHSERRVIQEKTESYDPALFLSRRGSRLVRFQHFMEDLFPGVKLHSFRHACATHMLKNGAKTAVLQKLLGHEKLSTTQLYTHLDMSDLHDMLQKHHPQEAKCG